MIISFNMRRCRSRLQAGQVKYLKYLNVSRNILKMFQALEIFEIFENNLIIESYKQGSYQR